MDKPVISFILSLLHRINWLIQFTLVSPLLARRDPSTGFGEEDSNENKEK
ncbi:hypothetical protein [uncultured Cedecea sp.]|nr:hypothetical protein [uncultured Cedecea sp.]